MFILLQWNCRSFGNKLHRISVLLYGHSPNLVCLHETRLKDHPDPIQSKHNHSYKKRDGHDVALCMYKTHTQMQFPLSSPLEKVAYRVRRGDKHLPISSLYCLPCGPIDNVVLHSLLSQFPGNNLVLGDCNDHHYLYQWLRGVDGRHFRNHIPLPTS